MSAKMFDKILIANRGEIACRVIKTCRRLGVRSVAVYSDADAGARHVRLADEAVHIGPAPARESYLLAERILDAARKSGAQAIHPGYGFLSENEAFAEACAGAGIVFIGPPVAAIRAMGSKSAAKALMEKAGVPLTPGYHGERQEPAFLRAQADAIGYPVLIKASAGGGGKGMRRVDSSAEFEAALASCQREAAASFGDDRVLVEKYLLRPRHIEIQVFGDTHGNIVHLHERDCSVQRRHQKVLEEAPAPGLSEQRRAAMGKAACEAARAVGYVGAGTIEFIADQDETFFFMEMNTRLQVEHPVTEMITGQDLVEWQLRVAAGEPLPLAQAQIPLRGHAIEARVYAEDADKNFLPSTGRLLHLSPPAEAAHVRVDTGVEQADEITPYYDPMIAKLIVWDESRERALARLSLALSQYRIVGVANNIEFLGRLVKTPSFATADLDTSLIERERETLWPPAQNAPRQAVLIAVLAELLDRSPAQAHDPWKLSDGWRINGALNRSVRLRENEVEHAALASYRAEDFEIALDGERHQVSGSIHADGRLDAMIDGNRVQATVIAAGDKRHVFVGGHSYAFVRVDPLAYAASGDVGEGSLLAPMPGRVVAVLAAVDAPLEKGAPLLILEAMKMEHTISAPANGCVRAFHFAAGEQVGEGAELLAFEKS